MVVVVELLHFVLHTFLENVSLSAFNASSWIYCVRTGTHPSMEVLKRFAQSALRLPLPNEGCAMCVTRQMNLEYFVIKYQINRNTTVFLAVYFQWILAAHSTSSSMPPALNDFMSLDVANASHWHLRLQLNTAVCVNWKLCACKYV